MEEIEIENLSELDPNKLYHIALAPDASQESIARFASAVNKLGLRALITRAGINIEAFVDMFEKLPEAGKQRLLAALNSPTKVEINPLEHEQSK